MKKTENKNSLKNFPADMLVVSGIPFWATLFIMSEFFYVAASYPLFTVMSALLVAMAGAGLLFWAKLPLYKADIYFSFGPKAIFESRKMFYYWGIGLAMAGCVVAGLTIPLCGRS